MRGTASLLAPGPLVSLLERLSSDLRVLERTVPTSEATHLLRDVEKWLETAIDEASQTDAFMSVEDLNKLTGRPESTLRRMCQRYGEDIGARKIGGTWTIHWNTFEKAWQSRTFDQMEFAA